MTSPTRFALFAALTIALAGCPHPPPAIADAADVVSAVDAASDDVATGEDTADVVVGDAGLVGERPYRSRVPRSYNAANPTPLVILLHGYTASGQTQELYFQLGPLAESRGFLYAFPDGMPDVQNRRFWNATNACCDFARTGVDDVAYITAIIDDMSARYNVDPRRIFLVGHSNGGFMSHRMACDRSSRIAAIVSLAGAGWSDAARCAPDSTVSVLQIHGTLDGTIAYTGGTLGPGGQFPGAVATVGGWAARNGCGDTLVASPMMLDLDTNVAGAETRVEAHAGCRPGGAAELWTIEGGGHVPGLSPTWAATIYDWLAAHPRP